MFIRTMLIDKLASIFDTYDGLIMATAPGHAPEGLHTTGDASLLLSLIHISTTS